MAFKRSMPQNVVDSLGGAYREFQAAMISGIALVVDPFGPEATVMHDILDTFLRDHSTLKELDETTKRELKIIEFLQQKAKAVEAEGPKPKVQKTENESPKETTDETSPVTENGSRPIRKRPTRSINTQDANLLLGISAGVSVSSSISQFHASNSCFSPLARRIVDH
jgi:hypothetical protein